jgi:hypothetical protein
MYAIICNESVSMPLLNYCEYETNERDIHVCCDKLFEGERGS